MDLEEFVDHFRARVVQDALAEATSSYWIRRAEQFEAARPRIGDFHGRATRDELRARWYELNGIAAACRNAATGARFQTEPEPLIFDAIREAA